jgi:hypothetical protein
MSIRSMILTLALCCFTIGCVEEGSVLIDEGTVEGVAPEGTTLTGITYLQQHSAQCHTLPKVTQCGGRSGAKLFFIDLEKADVLSPHVVALVENLLVVLATVYVADNDILNFKNILNHSFKEFLNNNDVDVTVGDVQTCVLNVLNDDKVCSQNC